MQRPIDYVSVAIEPTVGRLFSGVRHDIAAAFSVTISVTAQTDALPSLPNERGFVTDMRPCS